MQPGPESFWWPGGARKKRGVTSVVLSPEEAGDAGYCHLSQPTLKGDVHGAKGGEVPMGPELRGGSSATASMGLLGFPQF